MRASVKYNKLEITKSLLSYDLNDFTPSGNLSYNNEKEASEAATMMSTTPLKELYNLWRYIQHLILDFDCDYDDEDFNNPIDEDNCLLQTRGKYMKFVIYHPSTSTKSRQTSNQKLVSFRKGTKREETAYPSLKDEKYFDGSSRTLYITA